MCQVHFEGPVKSQCDKGEFQMNIYYKTNREWWYKFKSEVIENTDMIKQGGSQILQSTLIMKESHLIRRSNT